MYKFIYGFATHFILMAQVIEHQSRKVALPAAHFYISKLWLVRVYLFSVFIFSALSPAAYISCMHDGSDPLVNTALFFFLYLASFLAHILIIPPFIRGVWFFMQELQDDESYFSEASSLTGTKLNEENRAFFKAIRDFVAECYIVDPKMLKLDSKIASLYFASSARFSYAYAKERSTYDTVFDLSNRSSSTFMQILICNHSTFAELLSKFFGDVGAN